MQSTNIKILGLLITSLLLASPAFGQQFLWSTVQTDTIYEEYIPIDYAISEVLKFYNHYEKHYDFSGFSKKRFMDEINYGFDDWTWLNEIDEPSVFALRSNMGDGSFVLVMFVSKTNINLIIFSNGVLDGNFNYLFNDESEKFESWLKTLMH